MIKRLGLSNSDFYKLPSDDEKDIRLQLRDLTWNPWSLLDYYRNYHWIVMEYDWFLRIAELSISTGLGGTVLDWKVLSAKEENRRRRTDDANANEWIVMES